MKLHMLLLALCFLACNQSKKESQDATNDASTNGTTGKTSNGASKTDVTNTDPAGNAASTPYAIMTDPAFLGEWVQEYSVSDLNNNAILEEEERNGKKMNLGFDYFRFNQDQSCLRDRDMKLNGTFEISNASGKNKLIVRSNPPGENYTYTLAGYTSGELQLFTDGAFIVFKRP